MRQFNLYRRRGIFYVRFKDSETGKWSSGVSTGEREESAAMATVYGWERDGIPNRESRSVHSVLSTRRLIDSLKTADMDRGDAEKIASILRERGFVETVVFANDEAARPFLDFLREVWTFETSPYVRHRAAKNRPIGRKHAYSMLNHVNKWWANSRHFYRPDGSQMLLGEIRKGHIEAFAEELSEADVSDSTINHILNAGIAAFRYARKRELIRIDPTVDIEKVTVSAKPREIMTADEISRLFALDWPSSTARLASLVALTTGARAGEVAALRAEDIGDDRLHIRYSWGEHDGIKSPKNGEPREVPLLPAIRDQLQAEAGRNPHNESWVFWSSQRAGQPIGPRYFTAGLSDALVLLTLPRSDLDAARRVQQARERGEEIIDSEDMNAFRRVEAERMRWRDRGVTFHQWRHVYTSRIRDKVDLRAVQIATGHKTAKLAEELYGSHTTAQHFADVAAAGAEVFGNIIPFPQSGE